MNTTLRCYEWSKALKPIRKLTSPTSWFCYNLLVYLPPMKVWRGNQHYSAPVSCLNKGRGPALWRAFKNPNLLLVLRVFMLSLFYWTLWWLSLHLTGFDELTCHCGLEVIFPPIPCGIRPPECRQMCSRVHACEHVVSHSCHSEAECPPCVVLTTKLCRGGHEVSNTTDFPSIHISCHFMQYLLKFMWNDFRKRLTVTLRLTFHSTASRS